VRPDLRTGWRIAPDSPQDLAETLLEALDLRPSAREALAKRARNHVQSQFSLDRMVSETLDTYAALLEHAG
jgi:glycosyltransferase involved in cell wall biosynthesis